MFIIIKLLTTNQAVEDLPSDKLSDADKQLVKDKCAAEMSWLDANTLADKEEYEHHLKELQKVCSPIMTKIHQGGQGKEGPKVEEAE